MPAVSSAASEFMMTASLQRPELIWRPDEALGPHAADPVAGSAGAGPCDMNPAEGSVTSPVAGSNLVGLTVTGRVSGKL